MSDTARKYATIKHPTIEALIGGHYRYKDRAQALARFTSIAKNFVLSKEQPATTKDDPIVVFWIKGYALAEAELTEGFTGHFTEMRITKRKDGIFTLTATKVEKPLNIHPQKKRPSAKHPNWGHPVMRAVKRGKAYATVEAAQAELELLHLEFPEVTIPGSGKLYIIVYEKRPGITRPTHKIALEIEAQSGGGFIINHRDNEKTASPMVAKAKKIPSAQTEVSTPEFSTPGHFASVEEVRKLNRRRPRITAAVVEVKESDPGKFSATEKERKKRKKKKKLPRVSAAPPVDETEAQAQARFRAAELEREARRRRRTTIFDVNRKAKRDEPK